MYSELILCILSIVDMRKGLQSTADRVYLKIIYHIYSHEVINIMLQLFDFQQYCMVVKVIWLGN